MTESERERQREMLHEGLVDTVTRRIKRPDAHVAVEETVFELSRRHNDGDIHVKRFMDLVMQWLAGERVLTFGHSAHFGQKARQEMRQASQGQRPHQGC